MIARPAPMKKGMRQPQALISSMLRKKCCRTSSVTSASNWPPISVMYQTPE